MHFQVYIEFFDPSFRKGSEKLDRQLLENIKKIYSGIFIYNIVGILILFVIKKASVNTVGGLIAGSVVSMIALFLLARNIEALVEKEKRKAGFVAAFGYIIRLTMYAAVLIYAALSKNINIYTVAIGLISTNIVIKTQQLVFKKKHRKED